MKKVLKTTLVVILILSLFADVTGVFSLGTAQAATKKYTRYIKTETAKVYAEKSTDSTVVKTLKRNKKVTQYGKAGGGWAKISYATGKTGYILSAKLVKKRVNVLKAAKSEFKRIKAAVKGDNYWSWDQSIAPRKEDFGVWLGGRITNYVLHLKFIGVETSHHIEYEVYISETPYYEDAFLHKKKLTASQTIKLIQRYEEGLQL